MSDAPWQPKTLALKKKELREKAYSARLNQPDKDQASELICHAFAALGRYRSADTILYYLDCRSEVRTHKAVRASLETGKCIVIPYCTVNEQGNNKLGLWRIESLNELVAGMWNIMEPPKDRWGEPGKEVPPGEIDLALVPGVAFDVNGGRLGNGKGYYDRLLHEVRHDCELIGAGFQTQVFEQVPMDDHDVYLDGVLTETGFYRGKGRGPGNHG